MKQADPIAEPYTATKTGSDTGKDFRYLYQFFIRYSICEYISDLWLRECLRSPNRFYRNLSTITSSGIYKNLVKEVLATTTVATFVIGWNAIFGTYQDLDSVVHNGPMHDSLIPILSLPLAPFTLASPSLGLLLGKFVALPAAAVIW